MAKVVEDFKNNSGVWVGWYTVGGATTFTTSGSRWSNMRARCKKGGSLQASSPTYVGCTMTDCFKDFQAFTDWHASAVGYGSLGYQIDKDILFTGNKVYGEDTCVLVPAALNSFLTSSAAARGQFAQGVHYRRASRKFVAQLTISGKVTRLGLFNTESEAYSAYRAAKEAEAYRWYERLKAGEFVVGGRVIERMRTWRLEAGTPEAAQLRRIKL